MRAAVPPAVVSTLRSDHFASGAAERRISGERRGAERRRAAVAVMTERRSGADRRRLLDRREVPSGHLRHAIQLLEPLLGHDVLAGDERENLQVALRRLWWALRDIERPGSTAIERRITL